MKGNRGFSLVFFWILAINLLTSWQSKGQKKIMKSGIKTLEEMKKRKISVLLAGALLCAT